MATSIRLENSTHTIDTVMPGKWDGQSIIEWRGHPYVYSGSSNGKLCFSQRAVVRLDHDDWKV